MTASRPILITPPAAGIVSVEEAKQQCRVDDHESDAVFDRLIATATAKLDGWSGLLGRCLITQTWRQDFRCWPASGKLRLPFPDVQSVTITYRDADDTEITVSSSLHEIGEDAISSYVRLRDAFTSPSLYDDREFPVSVTFDVGYGDAAENVPATIRSAALMMISHWNEKREAVVFGSQPFLVPEGVNDLVALHRRSLL